MSAAMDGGPEPRREDAGDDTQHRWRLGRRVDPRDAIQQISHDRHGMYFQARQKEEAQ